jgi:hypothetical protein
MSKKHFTTDSELDSREPFLADEHTDDLIRLCAEADMTTEEYAAYMKLLHKALPN